VSLKKYSLYYLDIRNSGFTTNREAGPRASYKKRLHRSSHIHCHTTKRAIIIIVELASTSTEPFLLTSSIDLLKQAQQAMAPRSRLLDLEKQDVLFLYGDLVGVATHAILFWPVFLAAALLLRLVAPFPHAAAVCAGLYSAYWFLLYRAARTGSPPSSAGPPPAPSHTSSRRMMASQAYTIGQNP
jgi:hypothetical protein